MKPLYEAKWITLGKTRVKLGKTCIQVQDKTLTYSWLKQLMEYLEENK